MDSKQFDELVARLADGTSRRDALKGIAGGALAAVGVGAVAEAKGKKNGKGRAGAEGKKKGRGRGGAVSAERLPNGARCDPPRKCRPGSKSNKKCGCNRCNSDFSESVTNDKGKTVRKCACKPELTACTQDKSYQCCSNLCLDGVCATYGYG